MHLVAALVERALRLLHRRRRLRRRLRRRAIPRASASAPPQGRRQAPSSCGGGRTRRNPWPTLTRRENGAFGRDATLPRTSRLASRRVFPPAQAREADSDRGKEKRGNCERVRNPAHARPRARRGAPDGDRHAHPGARREGLRAPGSRTTCGAAAGSPTRSTTRPTAPTTCSSSTRSRRRSTRSARVLKITDGVMRHMATRRVEGRRHAHGAAAAPRLRGGAAALRARGARSGGQRRQWPRRPRSKRSGPPWRSPKPTSRSRRPRSTLSRRSRGVGGAGDGAGGGGLAWRTSTASSWSGT